MLINLFYFYRSELIRSGLVKTIEQRSLDEQNNSQLESQLSDITSQTNVTDTNASTNSIDNEFSDF